MKDTVRIKKICNIVIIAVFMIPVIVMGIYRFIYKSPDFSDVENRELAKMPELIESGRINREYYKSLEKFYVDRFPYREDLLRINRRIKTFYTIKLFDSGKDDVKFIAVDNSQNQVNAIITEADENNIATENENNDITTATAKEEEKEPDQEFNVTTFVPIIGGRSFELFVYNKERSGQYAVVADELATLCGIPTYVIMPPSASELYFPQKYRKAENEQKDALATLGSSLKVAKYVDLYDAFQSKKDDYIYFRSDHHWTARGAFEAYRGLGKAAGFDIVPLEDMESGKKEGFLGSLYKRVALSEESKVFEENPDTVEYFYPKYETKVYKYTKIEMTEAEERQVLYPDFEATTNYYNVFFGGDVPLMYMHSSIGNGKTIMVIRDSYGHVFLPFLANSYEHVYAIEPRYFLSFPLAKFCTEHAVDDLVLAGYSLPPMSQYWLDWVKELEKLKAVE